jgi:hypothetical protein
MNSPKAELTIATTLDDRNDLGQHPRRGLCRLDGKLAVWMRAPTKTGIVVDIGPIEKLAIPTKISLDPLREYRDLPLLDLIINQRFNGLLAHNPPTTRLHALDSSTLGFIHDLVLQIPLPTSLAEPMSTAQIKRLLVHFGSSVIDTADGTFERLLGGCCRSGFCP